MAARMQRRRMRGVLAAMRSGDGYTFDRQHADRNVFRCMEPTRMRASARSTDMKAEGVELGFNAQKKGLFHGHLAQIHKEFRRSPIGGCVYGGCVPREPAITSHVLSQCWLRSIARNGKVVGMGPQVRGSHFSTSDELVGVGEASVFEGFCVDHTHAFLRSWMLSI